MSQSDLKFAIVSSTAGSVMHRVLENDFFRRLVHSVVVDRHCGAIEKATAHGVHVERLLQDDNDRFCAGLLEYLTACKIDYVISYYTKFYSQKVRDAFQDRIINIHPSLLPAFKGMDGFGDSVAYHAKFVGNTVELIDHAMDEGKIVMQTACPLDANVPVETVRHRVFVQQCRALLQTVKWLVDGRISVRDRCVTVAGARFDSFEFSPALDFADACRFE